MYSQVGFLVGVGVVIQIDRPDPDTGEDFTVLEGRILAVENDEFALQTQSRTVIIKMIELLEIERKEGRKRSLTIRYLRPVTAQDVRQHLLDRHGMDYDVLGALDDEVAMELHNRTIHGRLGHRHEEKRTRRASTSGEGDQPPKSD